MTTHLFEASATYVVHRERRYDDVKVGQVGVLLRPHLLREGLLEHGEILAGFVKRRPHAVNHARRQIVRARAWIRHRRHRASIAAAALALGLSGTVASRW